MLTEEDWVKIYYAIDSKIASPETQGASAWKRHLRNIQKKIGKDGALAARIGVSGKNETTEG
jgi:hypothetical protein